MAIFDPAYEKMICNEGGYISHNIENDRGGQTYAGIARAFHGDWKGWAFIDRQDIDNPNLTSMVYDFYRVKFWNRIKGDEILSQRSCETIFDFSVNAGIRTSIKIAQIVIGSTPDGIMGPKSLKKINDYNEELFVSQYSLAKVARYAEIVNRDKSQSKFLLGWINRILSDIS